MPPLKIGILGYSDIARRRFIPAIQKTSVAKLAAISSTHLRGHNIPSEVYSVSLSSHLGLLNSVDVDLVYISLTNELHEKWCIKALEHGKHVICEKPLALTYNSVKRVIDAAESNKRLLFENIMYLQHPQHHLIKKIVQNGDIGELVEIVANFTIPALSDSNFRMNIEKGGGSFYDMNRYPLTLLDFFLNLSDIKIINVERKERDFLNISTEALLETASGVKFRFVIAFEREYRSCYRIIGRAGEIALDRAFTTAPDFPPKVIVSAKSGEKIINLPPADHFATTIEYVADIISKNRFEESHARSLKVAALADEIISFNIKP